MGNCLVVDEAVLNSQRLQKEMERDQKAKSHIVKLLLLGTGKHKNYLIFRIQYCYSSSNHAPF